MKLTLYKSNQFLQKDTYLGILHTRKQSLANMPTDTNNRCWTERVYQIVQGIVIVIIIILASIWLWVLFGRESKAKRVIKDVIVTLESEISTTEQTIECSLPELLNNGICNNEIRMEASCKFDHQDCKFNPQREEIAEEICAIIMAKSPNGILNCQGEEHMIYPYCKPCGHPMKSWLVTIDHLNYQLKQVGKITITEAPQKTTTTGNCLTFDRETQSRFLKFKSCCCLPVSTFVRCKSVALQSH